jgi:DNA-directed RNA polymerase specialized sigma24 family protein
VASPTDQQKLLLDCLGRLVAFASRRARSWSDGEDLAQAAMVLALYGGPRGGQQWDGQGDPFTFLCGVVRSQLKTRRRAKERGTTEDGPASADGVPASVEPEKLVLMREERNETDEQRAALEAAIEGDEVCRGVLALFEDDVTSEKEQAARLGVTLAEIKNARRRLKYAADRARGKEVAA